MSEVIPAEPGIVPEEPVAPEEPVWTGPSQEDWGQVQQTLGYLAEFVQSQQAPPEDPFSEVDPFDPQQLGAFIQHQVQQAISPIAEWQQTQQLSEAEERAFDIISDDVSRNGEFLLGEKAFSNIRAIANSYMEEEAARHGFGVKAAESALARAANDWREYEKELAQVAVERHMNQLSNIAGAPREPGFGSPAPAGQLQQGARTMDELIAKYGA